MTPRCSSWIFYPPNISPSSNDGTLERVISPASGHFGVSPLKNEGLLHLKNRKIPNLKIKYCTNVVRFHVKFPGGLVWMKRFGLKIGLKLKIIEFSNIWRVYFFGVFDHVSWNFGCQTFFFLAVFCCFNVWFISQCLKWRKMAKTPAWPYLTFVIF